MNHFAYKNESVFLWLCLFFVLRGIGKIEPVGEKKKMWEEREKRLGK